MNPGLVVKLRPTGPWRIGPDSGARNRVDAIYHSDSLYSAVTSAMALLGSLDEWLEATARSATTAVCFSSCFPFVDEIGFVAPPRTIWPPASVALRAAQVRWKSARFVPLGIVQSLLAGKPLSDKDWSVDGPSECLVPAGHLGPFRTSVRWSAAVDRLSGVTERHSTACAEFRSGAGLWTVVSFANEAAGERWKEPVKAAFRLLADSGFGGERSRGWGRSEAPEFVEGMLPDMILGSAGRERPSEPDPQTPIEEPSPVEPINDPPTEEPPQTEPPLDPDTEREPPEPLPEPSSPQQSAAASDAVAILEAAELESPSDADTNAALESSATQADDPAVEPAPASPALLPGSQPEAHWLLSLFTPAAADTVDWKRGNYTVLARGGRVESPAGSGELKKQVKMVTEGSVLYAASAPRGAASDVAPDGFAHPVFRAGFALAIPLPEVS